MTNQQTNQNVEIGSSKKRIDGTIQRYIDIYDYDLEQAVILDRLTNHEVLIFDVSDPKVFEPKHGGTSIWERTEAAGYSRTEEILFSQAKAVVDVSEIHRWAIDLKAIKDGNI